MRLHGHELTYVSNYSERELASWTRRIRRWMCEERDVHVYFDNDAYGNAPRNVVRLIQLVAR